MISADLQILSQIESLFQKYAFIHKDVLTIEEASVFTGLKADTLRQYVHKKKIGAYKPGRGKSAKLYFEKSELEKYMRGNRIESNEDLESRAATHSFLNRKAS